jgi:hypothetical protein
VETTSSVENFKKKKKMQKKRLLCTVHKGMAIYEKHFDSWLARRGTQTGMFANMAYLQFRGRHSTLHILLSVGLSPD